MTNFLAIVLWSIIALLILADIALSDATNLLFLAKKFTELTEWMAFWR